MTLLLWPINQLDSSDRFCDGHSPFHSCTDIPAGDEVFKNHCNFKIIFAQQFSPVFLGNSP